MINRLLIIATSLCVSLASGCKADESKQPRKNKAKASSAKQPRAKDKGKTPPKASPDAPNKPARKKQVALEPGKDLYGDSVPAGASVRMGSVRLRSKNTVDSLAVSPDGKRVATCSRFDHALWQVQSGKRLRSFKGCDADVYFSADGTELIASDSGNLNVLDATSGAVKRTFKLHTENIKQFSVSQDRTKALVLFADASLRLVALATGKQLRVFKVKGSPGSGGVALSFDGRWAALQMGSNRVFNTATGKLVKLAGLEKTDTNDALAFSPDNKQLAISDVLNVRIWDLATGKIVTTIATKHSQLNALLYNPAGLLTTVANNKVTMFDTKTGKASRVFEHPSESVAGALFTPDGKRLITIGYRSSSVRVFDVASGKELFQRPAHHRRIEGIVFTDSGNRLLSYDSRASTSHIRVWNSKNGSQQTRFSAFAGSAVPTIKTVARGKDHIFVLGAKAGVVHIWDAQTKKPYKSLKIETKPESSSTTAIAIAIAPTATVAAALTDHDAVVWDVTAGKQRATWKVPDKTKVLALSPDGRWVATGTHFADGPPEIKVWNATSGALAHTLKGHTGYTIKKLLFLADGRLVSTAGDDFVRFWDVATGKLVHKMPSKSPGNMAATRDGKRLAVVSSFGKLTIWDLAKSALIRTLKVDSWANKFAFSPDGKTLACTTNGLNVLLWSIGK